MGVISLASHKRVVGELRDELASEQRWAKHYSDRAEQLHRALELSNAILRNMQHARPIDLDALGKQVAENVRILERQV